MKTLAEQIREIIDTLDEYVSIHDPDFESEQSRKAKLNIDPLRHVPGKKGVSHVVPGSPEGILAQKLNADITDMLSVLANVPTLDIEARKELEAKITELGVFVQKKLQ